MFWKTFWNFLVRRKISPAFGRKKTGNLFLISCFCVAVNSGGYSVVIPQKQTCSPCLKRFLCRWGFGCPALSFSASCKSHLSRLTGSYRFPCSIRLQRFVLLWIPVPDWRQGNRVRHTLNGWGLCLYRLSVPDVDAVWFPIPEKLMRVIVAAVWLPVVSYQQGRLWLFQPLFLLYLWM